MLGNCLGQFRLGTGAEITAEQQVQHGHEVTFTTAEAAVQVGALAGSALQRGLDQGQGRVKAERQLLRHDIIRHRVAGLGHAFAEAHHEIAFRNVFGQVDEVAEKWHGGR